MTNEEIHVALVTLELKLAELEKRVQERGRVLGVLAFAAVTPVIGLIAKGLFSL